MRGNKLLRGGSYGAIAKKLQKVLFYKITIYS